VTWVVGYIVPRWLSPMQVVTGPGVEQRRNFRKLKEIWKENEQECCRCRMPT